MQPQFVYWNKTLCWNCTVI